MPNRELGWDWFETDAATIDHEKLPFDDLAHVFARCFRGEDGKKVLCHLKNITHSRILGPNASDSLLRHVEGQRHLVSQIISLVDYGRSHDYLGNTVSTNNASKTVGATYD